MKQATERTPGPWLGIGANGGGPTIRTEGGNWVRATSADVAAMKACPELLRVVEAIRDAYLDGPHATFHTRLNELADGDFAGLLISAIEKAEVAA